MKLYSYTYIIITDINLSSLPSLVCRWSVSGAGGSPSLHVWPGSRGHQWSLYTARPSWTVVTGHYHTARTGPARGTTDKKINTAHVEYKQGKQPTWKPHNVQIFWLAFLPDTGSYFNILHVSSSKMGKLHEYLLGRNGEQEMVYYKSRYNDHIKLLINYFKEDYWYTLANKVLSEKEFFLGHPKFTVHAYLRQFSHKDRLG